MMHPSICIFEPSGLTEMPMSCAATILLTCNLSLVDLDLRYFSDIGSGIDAAGNPISASAWT